MAEPNSAQMLIGAGLLHWAPLGTAEPVDTTTAMPSAWSPLGYCVDEETEILTRRGWMHHDEVLAEDETITISAEDGLARWQPILAMHRFAAGPREMVRMVGASHDSLSTPNHRWLVDRRPDEPSTGRCGGIKGLTFATTETFKWADRVPCAAPVVNLPTEAKYTDAFVELVAWWITEGSMLGPSIAIYQSETANPQHCATIRSALTSSFGAAVPSMYMPGTAVRPDKSPTGRRVEAAWREGENKGCAVFYLNQAASAPLLDVAPDKIVGADFLNALTRSQLRLLLSTAIKGDGWGSHLISQSKRERLDPLQMAASMAGLRTSLRWSPNQSEWGGDDVWTLNILSHDTFRPRRMAGRGARFTMERVQHDGMIWCPKTPASTWLARRNGMVYFTGNTEQGTEVDFQLTTADVLVAEEFYPVAIKTTAVAAGVKFSLAEITAAHMAFVLNGGTSTVVGLATKVEPPAPNAETRIMLVHTSDDTQVRHIFRRCINSGGVQLVQQKAPAKGLYACDFRLEKPTGLQPWAALFLTSARA